MRSLVVVGGIMLAVRGTATADVPTATEIVKEMTATYAAASTYEDMGTLTEAVRGHVGMVVRFTTGFERGRKVRLDLPIKEGNVTSYVIWSDFQHVLIAQGNNIDDTHRALGETLGGASKITFGFTSTVPPLLMPGEAGQHARGLANLALVGVEKVGEHPCWRLEHDDLALWIDQESHLLRKRIESGGLGVVTTVFEPVVNGQIPPAHLTRPTIEPTPTAQERVRQSEEQSRTLIGHEAPSFTADRVSGPYPSRLDKLGGHVVVLEFFASWCPPCGPAAEELKKIDRAHAGEGVRTIALSNETTTDIERFGTDNKVGFTLGRDNLGRIQRAYHLEVVPSVVIIDQDGIVRDVMIGVSPPDLETAITRLTTQSPPAP